MRFRFACAPMKLALAAAMLVAYLAPAHAERLGGVDLQRYCRATTGTDVRRVGSTVNDWRCGSGSLSVNNACRMTYGRGARAAYGNFGDANSWYCYH